MKFINKELKPVLIKSKLISAILPKGVALGVIRRLRDERNINAVNMNYARGNGRLTQKKYGSGCIECEKEILTVVVDEEHSEEVFEYIYKLAGINKPHGGLMYMHPLIQSSEYVLPDTLEEEL